MNSDKLRKTRLIIPTKQSLKLYGTALYSTFEDKVVHRLYIHLAWKTIYYFCHSKLTNIFIEMIEKEALGELLKIKTWF